MAKNKNTKNVEAPKVKSEEIVITPAEAVEVPAPTKKPRRHRKPAKKVQLSEQDQADLKALETANMEITNGETVMVTVSVVNNTTWYKRVANWFKGLWNRIFSKKK